MSQPSKFEFGTVPKFEFGTVPKPWMRGLVVLALLVGCAEMPEPRSRSTLLPRGPDGALKPAADTLGSPLPQADMGLPALDSGSGQSDTGSIAPNPTPTQPNPNDEFAALRDLCVELINGYRAQEGAAPLVRDAAKEPCADQQCKDDGAQGVAHATRGACGEAMQAQYGPGYGISQEQALRMSLQMMWDEGPTGVHHRMMAMPGITKVACGFGWTPNGSVWGVQDYSY